MEHHFYIFIRNIECTNYNCKTICLLNILLYVHFLSYYFSRSYTRPIKAYSRDSLLKLQSLLIKIQFLLLDKPGKTDCSPQYRYIFINIIFIFYIFRKSSCAGQLPLWLILTQTLLKTAAVQIANVKLILNMVVRRKLALVCQLAAILKTVLCTKTGLVLSKLKRKTWQHTHLKI